MPISKVTRANPDAMLLTGLTREQRRDCHTGMEKTNPKLKNDCNPSAQPRRPVKLWQTLDPAQDRRVFRQTSQFRPTSLVNCLLAGVLAFLALIAPLQSQEKSDAHESTVKATASPRTEATLSIPASITSGHEATLLRRIWGIDDVHIRSTASGSLIRFSYRVVDADKAKVLNDKKATPYLIDEKHGLALQIPVLEQVGQLRQVSTPQNGREYWMAFSNKGRSLTPGSHVTVVIGGFSAEELVVESSSAIPH